VDSPEDAEWDDWMDSMRRKTTRKQTHRDEARRMSAVLSCSSADEVLKVRQEILDAMWEDLPDRWRTIDVPQVGDLVTYPLPEVVVHNNHIFGDTRTRGLGLLVGRNIDRGDVRKVAYMTPDDSVIAACEVIPLMCGRRESLDRPDEECDTWVVDSIGVSAYPTLDDLERVEEGSWTYDSKADAWLLAATYNHLSPNDFGEGNMV